MSEQACRYSHMYQDADSSFLVNWGSKTQRPIRISLPKPPPLHLIEGWGKHPDDQYFKRMEVPKKLQRIQDEIMRKYSEANRGVNGSNILRDYWKELEHKSDELKDEVIWMKHFIWHLHHGYWFFNDGKPTYLSPWYFSFLHLHRMTTDMGYVFPEYREIGRLRFMFRDYLFNTDETFADLDAGGKAYKVNVNGKKQYRIVKVGRKLFFGSIEPKGRRQGLTNEACHVITCQATRSRGADKLCTIVSMGGDNADTHFRKKLIPAWGSWPLFTRPVWIGGFGKLKTLEFAARGIAEVETIDSSINFTESGDDLANDGKMLLGALYDEQGKGKRTGNVQNRWQINKEAMSLGGGTNIIGFCMHPSTVEKMQEGGQDYKDMCDISDFYVRKKDGQTISGLSVLFLPSSFCLEGYVDRFGQPVLKKPSERQLRLGFKGRIGSKIFIENKRKDLYDPDNPVKMDEYRSFVRKFPEKYEECWTGVAGTLGFDNESIRTQVTKLRTKGLTVQGDFEWVNRQALVVDFKPKKDGKWSVNMTLPRNEANQTARMLDYSSFEDDEIWVNRPKDPTRFILGLDPTHFNNKSESQFLKTKGTKQSDTGIVVKRIRDKTVDISQNPKEWKTCHFVASCRKRLSTSKEAADEAIKAAVYYGALMHVETNVSVVWERIVEMKFGGYLNYMLDYTADGVPKRAGKPGTALATGSKKNGFTLLADQFNNHSEIEPMLEMLEEADEISAMEELTKYDLLAAAMQAKIGETSDYRFFMEMDNEEYDTIESLGAKTYYV